MNSWLLAVLCIILIHYLLETGLTVLNVKALSPKLPGEFDDTFDEEHYLKSQQYTKRYASFGLLEKTISTVITILFILSGGFNSVDLLARHVADGPIVTGLVFSALLGLLAFLVGLPFSIYATFVIEEKFGFNRTTVKTFILDHLKGGILAILFGGPLLALILFLFINGGAYAWFFCWIGVALFSVILQFLAPVLIMPLFNKFTPLADGPLKTRIIDYAGKQNFTISGIYTMDSSRRSAKLNAFFTGFGRFRKIVFYDTLLEKLNEDEILAVLAHEMGHFKKKHILKMMFASLTQTGLMFFLLSMFLENPGLFAAFGMEHISIYASLVFFAFLYTPINTVLSIFANVQSRKYEFEADQFAARTTGLAGAMISGLKQLSKENLSNLTPHPLLVFFSYSHPPVLNRIRVLRQVKIS